MNKKKINIHQDYIMFQLMSHFRSQLHLICTYMQDKTPWSQEYQNAYNFITNLDESLDKLEELLQECIERKEVK